MVGVVQVMVSSSGTRRRLCGFQDKRVLTPRLVSCQRVPLSRSGSSPRVYLTLTPAAHLLDRKLGCGGWALGGAVVKTRGAIPAAPPLIKDYKYITLMQKSLWW